MKTQENPFEIVATTDYHGGTKYNLNYKGFHIGSYDTLYDAKASKNRWFNTYKRSLKKKHKYDAAPL
jgi:hypothetical protein